MSERWYGKNINKNDKVSFQVSIFLNFIFDPEEPNEVLDRSYIADEMNNKILVLSKMLFMQLPKTFNKSIKNNRPTKVEATYFTFPGLCEQTSYTVTSTYHG